ncbi:MAG: energy transducer TonB [Candidatus Cloacimonas sp.]|nr:energy transducer TonB [Candidatus Cloacimonadota bacterium]
MALNKQILVLLIILFSLSFGVWLTASETEEIDTLKIEIKTELPDTTKIIPAKVMKRTPPILPQDVDPDEIEGVVSIEVFLMPTGEIARTEIKNSIPELDSLAVETIKDWTFSPAIQNRRAIFGSLTVDVDFSPEGVAEIIKTEKKGGEYEFDLVAIRDSLDELINGKQEPFNHTLTKNELIYQSENYHLIASQQILPYTTKNGFSVIPVQSTPFHLFQNYYPFYDYEVYPNRWSFDNREYVFPITFAEANLGIGFMKMDYGHFTVAKNNSFGVKDLQVYSSVLMQDGFWMGGYEKSSNFFLNVKYPYRKQLFNWQSMTVTQDIPLIKLRNSIDPDLYEVYTEKIVDHAFTWQNPIVNAGFRLEKVVLGKDKRNEKPERKILQLMLERPISWKKHKMTLSWEHLIIEETPKSFSSPYLAKDKDDVYKGEYEFRGDVVNLHAVAFNGLNCSYHLSGELSLQPFQQLSFGPGVLLSKLKDDSVQFYTYPEDDYFHQLVKSDYYGFINYFTTPGEVSLSYGIREIEQNDNIGSDLNTLNKQSVEEPYIKLGLYTSKKIFGLKWSLKSDARYGMAETLDYLPKWILRNNIEWRKDFPYDNGITVGLTHYYTSQYTTPMSGVGETSNLDGYVRISITPLFDIQADVKNLLQKEHSYGSVIPGLHWNAGVRWYFIN